MKIFNRKRKVVDIEDTIYGNEFERYLKYEEKVLEILREKYDDVIPVGTRNDVGCFIKEEIIIMPSTGKNSACIELDLDRGIHEILYKGTDCADCVITKEIMKELNELTEAYRRGYNDSIEKVYVEDLKKISCEEYVEFHMQEIDKDEKFRESYREDFKDCFYRLAKGEGYVYVVRVLDNLEYFSQYYVDKHKIKNNEDKEFFYV